MERKRARSSPSADRWIEWYAALEALTAPLTTPQKDEIRAALPQKQSAQFLRDWPRFGEIVWRYAFNNHGADTRPSNKKSLDKEIKAANAALKALNILDQQLDTFQKH